MCAIWEEIRNDGVIEGKIKEKVSTLLTILKTKLGGYISAYLTKEIENSNIETLDILTKHILEVENEEDVMKIIHHK
jgi:hypothetical protein